MKIIKFLIVTIVLVLISGTAEAQLLKKIGNAAKRTLERKAEEKTEEAVGKAIDKVTDPGTYKDDDKEKEQQEDGVYRPASGNQPAAPETAGSGKAPAQTPQQEVNVVDPAPQKQGITEVWDKFDFVSGDEIMFEDNQATEKLGEFPSMWDLKSGKADIVNVNGEHCIYLTQRTRIIPLMKEMDYLPDAFTIEMDVYVPGGEQVISRYTYGNNCPYIFSLRDANNKVIFQLKWDHRKEFFNRPTPVRWAWLSGDEKNEAKPIRLTDWSRDGENRGILEYTFKYNDFNRLSISFNKRALKVYLNETRIVNIPRCDASTKFEVYAYGDDGETKRFIKNIRIAKGAIPLYDRMMSDGKFISYGITFDINKSNIKPESMGEINRIVQLMNENPTLKFSVEGHTDNTGDAAYNQTLSDARSKAVVDQLVAMGVSTDRLASAGKGQNNPIADNGTDEGRAKNRRVEFVKQ